MINVPRKPPETPRPPVPRSQLAAPDPLPERFRAPQGRTAAEQFRASSSSIGYLGDSNVFLAFDVETARLHFGCRYNAKVLCVDLPRAALCACNAQAEDFFAYKEPLT